MYAGRHLVRGQSDVCDGDCNQPWQNGVLIVALLNRRFPDSEKYVTAATHQTDKWAM